MRFVKCPVCKSLITPHLNSCPICRTKFTQFQRFNMVWTKRIIFFVLLAFVFYNFAIIINENRKIRHRLNNIPRSTAVIEKLEQDYENLNFIQKLFVNKEDIELIKERQKMGLTIISVVDEERTVYFDDGGQTGLYTGNISANQPNGKGVFKYAINEWLSCVYNGQFKGGRITGFGEMNFSNGYKYVGNFVNGKLNGYATVFNPQGYVVERGEFINDKLSGNGIMYDNLKNIIYSGNFENGLPSKDEYIKACLPVSIDSLQLNMSEYTNKNIKIHGRIIDIIEHNDSLEYIVSPDDLSDVRISVYHMGNELSVERRDYVYIYGCCMGEGTYFKNAISVQNGIGIVSFYMSEITNIMH